MMTKLKIKGYLPWLGFRKLWTYTPRSTWEAVERRIETDSQIQQSDKDIKAAICAPSFGDYTRGRNEMYKEATAEKASAEKTLGVSPLNLF